MNEPKISVIIPVYKVEPYIRQCLDSVVNQTYRNLEIILVDDGSPDNCGEICDQYAQQDPRIKVIHKKNGGVSSARNAGLSITTGDYIGWVDPDDWIEPNLFSKLIETAIQTDADITVCGRVEEYPARSIVRTWDQHQSFTVKEALANLLKNDVMQNYLWDKLWKRWLFYGITFPEGRTFEDVSVMSQLFQSAHHIVCIPDVLYHYRQHDKSIIGNTGLPNRMNYYIAFYERYQNMVEQWPEFKPLLQGQCVAAAISIWCCYFANPKNTRIQYKFRIEEISKFCAENYKSALQYMSLGVVGKAVIRLTPYPKTWAFVLAWLVSRGYRVVHNREL